MIGVRSITAEIQFKKFIGSKASEALFSVKWVGLNWAGPKHCELAIVSAERGQVYWPGGTSNTLPDDHEGMFINRDGAIFFPLDELAKALPAEVGQVIVPLLRSCEEPMIIKAKKIISSIHQAWEESFLPKPIEPQTSPLETPVLERCTCALCSISMGRPEAKAN